ncbi:hypothetical protein BDM02DRAFT_3120003 [Thelephora ganbajun]|uniref:Uncharacterized protein n=1 Tax=Thelephora ganbajun TaxID=370292 RepID=A0ACB6Z785_THEGA|nr:hypothetical protein BDM02DRAFT_3120003 [Thelephora ganbajun]
MVDAGYVSATHSQRIVFTCGKGLKSLKFEIHECVVPGTMLRTLVNPNLPLSQVGAPMSLLSCPELRELEFSVLYLTEMHKGTVFHHLHKHLQGHIFVALYIALYALMDHARWTPFNDYLSAFIDELRKSRYDQTLEMELRIAMTLDSPMGHEGFLPKLREEGQVRDMDYSSGQVLELAVCLFSFLLALGHYLRLGFK